MRREYFAFMVICLLVLSFATKKVKSEQPQEVVHGSFDYMTWEIDATKDVAVGQEFSVTCDFRPQVTLDIVRVDVSLYGNIGQDNTWDTWSWTNTTWYSDIHYTRTANFTAAREGGVFAYIIAVYDDAWKVRHTLSVNPEVTRIWNRLPQELQSDYDSLNQSYITLQKSYDSLESNLNSIRTTVYILVLTTSAFIGTTVYFAIRKPKVKTV